jgi:hypothetical protein
MVRSSLPVASAVAPATDKFVRCYPPPCIPSRHTRLRLRVQLLIERLAPARAASGMGLRISGLAMKAKPSVDFGGYRRRRLAA